MFTQAHQTGSGLQSFAAPVFLPSFRVSSFRWRLTKLEYVCTQGRGDSLRCYGKTCGGDMKTRDSYPLVTDVCAPYSLSSLLYLDTLITLMRD